MCPGMKAEQAILSASFASQRGDQGTPGWLVCFVEGGHIINIKERQLSDPSGKGH